MQFSLSSQLKQLFSIANSRHYFKAYWVVFTFKALRIQNSHLSQLFNVQVWPERHSWQEAVFIYRIAKSSVLIFMPILWLMIFNEICLHLIISSLILLTKYCTTVYKWKEEYTQHLCVVLCNKNYQLNSIKGSGGLGGGMSGYCGLVFFPF